MTEIIIVGAGPYGLSLAAHLRSLGVDFRIFGGPMLNWSTKMPRGMLLKSDPFASNLCAPEGAFTLKDFCQREGIPYADEGKPISVENFIAYGEAFQRRFVPEVEERFVVALDRVADGFAVQLDDGEMVVGRKVVIAIGISDFPYMPATLAPIPGFVSHASQHVDMGAFRGRELAVVGAGSSAVDLAALLHEGGASVHMVTRRPLRIHGRVAGAEPTLAHRLRHPNTGIGPGWKNVFFTRTPHLFRLLPQDRRRHWVEHTHGPAGGWFMRDRVIGKVALIEGFAPSAAEPRDGRVDLHLSGQDGAPRTLTVDHVIAATGYKIDLRAVKFLPETLRGEIALLGPAPELSPHFETSVPGLYIVGPAAAYSFGPLFRFVAGVEFAAPRLARHFAASLSRRPMAPETRLAAPPRRLTNRQTANR